MTDERPPRPTAVTVDPGGIPEELQDRHLWLVWRYEWQDDREEWAKIPKDGSGGGYSIDATDPENGVGFDTALETYHSGDHDGLRIITDPDDLLVGFDCDYCRDPEHPHSSVSDPVADLLETLDTYTEVSPSETGYRAFALGTKPDGPTRADLPCDPVLNETPHLEVYDGSGGRYLTVTGQHVSGTPDTIETRPQEITAVCEEYLVDDEPLKPTSDGGVSTAQDNTTPRVNAPESGPRDAASDLSDDELIERAKNAGNGDKFRQLWNGDTSEHPSHSEADLALCGLLTFWTGGDRQRIDRLFRQSGLYREKWDRDDYRERTIKKALSGRTEYYNPNAGTQTTPTPDKPGGDDHHALTWDDVIALFESDANGTTTEAYDKAVTLLTTEHDFVTIRETGEMFL